MTTTILKRPLTEAEKCFLRRKEYWLCELSLDKVARGQCGAVGLYCPRSAKLAKVKGALATRKARKK